MTDKWNLVVDVARCNNCGNCALAAMDEHVGNDFPGYAAPQPKHGPPWITIRRCIRGSGNQVDVAYLPTLCNHCDQPPCANGAEGAVVKRDDGIVLIDPAKARGRRDLVEKCPYGAIHWNEELQLPQTWIFDAHLLDAGWSAPRCEQACPTRAIRALKVSDAEMEVLARRESLRPLRPELGTAPRVYYRNLHRFESRFVAGSVVQQANGVVDAVEGCAIVLEHEGAVAARAVSDWFGDFRMDGLPDESLAYDLLLEHSEHGSRRMAIQTAQTGTNLGILTLDRAARGAPAETPGTPA